MYIVTGYKEDHRCSVLFLCVVQLFFITKQMDGFLSVKFSDFI